jgi:tRNA threonylcarbamoyladenosine biosynthesis protein TsaE
MDTANIEISLKDLAATEDFAERISSIAMTGDTILLHGEIGAGKTSFARAFIRALTFKTNEIPSPTFTIVQTYESSKGEIWHCDLYRITDPDEAVELGLEDAFEDSIVLIEWPDRLGSILPTNALNIFLSAEGEGRKVRLQTNEVWARRLQSADV